MSSAELSAVLNTIKESLKSCGESLDKLEEVYEDESGESWRGDKVSLLSLKNGSMLSYLSSLMVVLGEKLGKDGVASRGREEAIEQRVVLERGVKPLEKKLGYQLDKLTRAYMRMEADLQASQVSSTSGKEKEKEAAEEEEEDSSESEDETQFRPNGSAMVTGKTSGKASGKARAEANAASSADAEASGSIYRPPKISAALPPQHHFEDKFNAQEHKDKSSRSRMQAMEEYLKETSEQPEWEASIGANIVNHGRGGVKTSRDTERERDIQRFEEENFTRLNPNGSKVDKRLKKQREISAKVNMIAGEDFSIFNSKRKLEESTSRRGSKKSRNAWERAKRKL
ncbi:U3 small nucleolar ribonucleoprotein LCP5 [Kluyveromyces marxianus]